MFYTYYESPIGRLLIAGDGSRIKKIDLRPKDAPGDWIAGDASLSDALDQLREYFAGERYGFDLPLAPEGTAFQQEVWRAVRQIPYGETTTYGAIAARIGHPTASRAVGAANGANPIPIIIPCHRVIGSSGKLTGFGGGLEMKARLLSLEGVQSALPFN